MLVTALRYWPYVGSPEPLLDEVHYVRAFRAAAEGSSPYDGSYFVYLPVMAHAGGWLLDLVGLGPTLAVLRTLNLLGAAWVAWIAATILAGTWWRRLGAAAFYLCLAPPVDFGLALGNLSPLVSGMVVAALVLWPRRPIAAGWVLGLSTLVKPVAPAAIVALGVHRPRAGGRRHVLAAAVALATLAAGILAFPDLGGLHVRRDFHADTITNVSINRLLSLLGLPTSPLVVAAVVAVACAVAVRARRLDPETLLSVAIACAVAATPLVWSHTLLLTLPLQAAALAVAWGRLRRASAMGLGRRWRHYELTAVLTAALSLQLADTLKGLVGQPQPLVLLATALPALAPAGLALYLLWALGKQGVTPAWRREPARAT